MADVIYKKGQSSNLNTTRVPIVEGQILVTEDTAEMYIDMSDGNRKQITDTNKQDKFMTKEPLETFRSTFLTIDDKFDLYHKTYSSGISLDPGKGDFYGEGTSILSTASTNLTINNDNKAKFNYDDGSGEAQPVPVTGIATPKSDSPNDQAANKEYVDTAIANASIGGGGNVTIDLVGKKTEGNGEIFNDYENNKAYHNFTTAEGTQTNAGSMGYKIIDFNPRNLTLTVDGDATALLDEKVNKARDSFGLDNAVSIQIEQNFEFCCNIVSVETFSGEFDVVGNYDELKDISPVEQYEIVSIENVSSGTTYTLNYVIQLKLKDDNKTLNVRTNSTDIYGYLDRYLPIGTKVLIRYEDVGSSTVPCTISKSPTSTVIVDKLPADATNETVSSGSYLWTACTPEIGNVSIGTAAHAEGYGNKAVQACSHTEGFSNVSAGKYSHTEGKGNIAVYSAHAEGNDNKALGISAHTEGSENIATRSRTHAEGYKTKALFDNAHAEGNSTTAGSATSGNAAHAEGRLTQAIGNAAHAEGSETQATVDYAHAEGEKSKASGIAAHAEGASTASKKYAHAEGKSTASGESSHSEGAGTKATNSFAHAEGDSTTASGIASHSEGGWNTAAGTYSHSEGSATHAGGNFSHAEGRSTTASAEASHSGGIGTKAVRPAQTAIGIYNYVSDESDNHYSLFAIGNGRPEIKENGVVIQQEVRQNAFRVMTDGTAELQEQGTSDNSVVINKTLMDAINSKFRYFSVNETIPNDLPEGTFVFVYED